MRGPNPGQIKKGSSRFKNKVAIPEDREQDIFSRKLQLAVQKSRNAINSHALAYRDKETRAIPD